MTLDSRPLDAPVEPSSRSSAPVWDVALILGWFAVAGVLVGIVWNAITTPPYFVRTSDNVVMYQVELAKQIQADGNFMMLGVAASAIGGLVVFWRSSRPVASLLLGTVATPLSGWLALVVGERLGRSDVTALAKQVEVGGHIRDSLGVGSHWVLAAWLFGFLVVTTGLFMVRGRDRETDQPVESGS